MVFAPCADYRGAITENREISLPVERKLKLFAHLSPVEDEFDAGPRTTERHHGPNVPRLAQMHACERPQRTVMPHERIGDWADDPHRSGTETRIQFILKI